MPRQGIEQLKRWRRSTREFQWEGTCRVGFRSISDEEPPDSTSTSYFAAKAASFYREKEIRSPAKGQLKEPSPAITRMLGDFM